MESIFVNGREFEIIKLLGHGKGGYSYLVRSEEGLFVVKQIHHEPCDYYSFGNKLEAELRDHKRLAEIGIRMPKLLDADVQNERILKEYIEGETAFELVLTDRMDEALIGQVRDMCALLYPAKTNIDYFPTNFVLKDGLLYYVDYECNDYMEEWDFEHWGIKYWSKTEEFSEYVRKQSK